MAPIEELPESATFGDEAQTILLVEDHDAVRRMTGRILEKHGYTVLQACNGPEALALMSEDGRRIDLLLSDLVMPHMSGLELGRRVAEAYPHVHLLYMSGYSHELLSAGRTMDRKVPLISKPFAPAQLLTGVREALEG